jgi:CheY-like chemotaxis protein
MKREQPPLEGLRILIAEDNVFAAMELERIILECGCTPIGPVATVEQALRLVREEPLDGAVLDINLRDRSVIPVAEELIRRGIRLIFATGYEAGYALPTELASRPCLRKPYAGQQLRRLMLVVFRPEES